MLKGSSLKSLPVGLVLLLSRRWPLRRRRWPWSGDKGVRRLVHGMEEVKCTSCFFSLTLSPIASLPASRRVPADALLSLATSSSV